MRPAVVFFFFLSAFQPKLHLICAGRCIIVEASELIFIEFICSLNKDGGIWRIKAAWNIADYAALFFRDLLIPRLPLLFLLSELACFVFFLSAAIPRENGKF